MKKRIFAILLVSVLLFQTVQVKAYAAGLTEEELHVSDEFTEAYPNGYFDLATAVIEAHEYSGRVGTEVVRSGGTSGRVVVRLKAINVTASEEDYILDVPDELALDEDEAVLTESPELDRVTRSTGLRAVREAATGTKSDRIQYTEQEKSEMVQTAREAVEDYYADIPGKEFTLVFESGERYKSFDIEIINDDISEAEEQLILVMTSVSGGGVIGDQRETIVNIVDDEELEMPVLQFSAESYTAESGTAEVTLVRTAGLNNYAGGTLITIDASAEADLNYTATTEEILFLPGQETLTISVPVDVNTSGQELTFMVQMLSNGSCAISGNDTVKVIIPNELRATSRNVAALPILMGSYALKPVTLGVPSITYGGSDAGPGGVEANFDKVGNTYATFKRTGAGWYEVKIENNQMRSGVRLRRSLYKNMLSSIKTDMTLYECGHENNFDVDIWTDLKQGSTTSSGKLIRGREGYDDKKVNLNVNFSAMNNTDPFSLAFYIQNGNRDYGAIRLYSLTLNFKHYKFEVVPTQDTKYTFDFASGTSTPSTVIPGTIEIRDYFNPDNVVDGVYMSQNHILDISTKDVETGYYLKELRIYDNRDSNKANYITIPTGRTGATPIVNDVFLNKYGSYALSDGTFLIQPVFERDAAKLSVSIAGSDRGKGHVQGVTFPDTTGDANVTFTKNNNPDEDAQITLRVGDTINLVGVGQGENAITGFYTSVGMSSSVSKKTEVVGAENAGVITLTLDEENIVTPIFGERSFAVRRDPDMDNNLVGKLSMGITGVESGGITFTDSGELTGVKSGQEVNILVIPPEGYTTQWTNRSGDTNFNGRLDDNEIRDNNGNLFLRYDYNGDGELDADYKYTLYGDLLRSRINQPQTLYYYSFVPLAGPFTTGQVTGYLKTYEYDIYHGYATAVDRTGVTIKKLVPVSDASTVMGGSYNQTTEGADPSYATVSNYRGKFAFDVNNVLKNAPYFLSIRNGTASFYSDYIVPSLSGSNYVIPLFSSMRPVSISASTTSKGNTVAGSVITLNKELDVTFALDVASLESNIAVDNVNFIVYDEDGVQRSKTTVPVNYGTAKYKVDDVYKAFQAGDTLKAVLMDQNGNETVEYNTGYEFRPSIKSPVGLPSFVSPVESVVIPLFDSVAGGLNLGSVSTDVLPVGDTYTIRIGDEKAFEGTEKILHQTGKPGAEGEAAKKEIIDKNSTAPEKEDSNVKSKTSVSSKIKVKASLELIIKYSSEEKNYYFGSLQMMVTLSNDSELHHETSVTLPVGLTIVAKLDIGGEVTGFIKVTPVTRVGQTTPLKNYMDEYGNFEYTDSNMFKDDNYRYYFEGGLIVQPKISLSIAGNFSIGSVEVEGSAEFRLIFTTASHNSGVVTLKAGMSVKTFGIQVYSKNFGSVEYNLFGSQYMFALYDPEATEEFDFFAPVEVEYERSSWLGKDLPPQNPGPGAYGFTEATLLTGVYPNPDTQTMRVGDNSLLMVFIDTASDRDAYNKAALYYSISDNNGTSYGEPVLLNDDGTTDSMPNLIDLGDRIACIYSTIGTFVSSTTKMEQLLEQAELEMLFFDKETCTWSEPIRVTEYTAVEDEDGSLVGDFFTNSHATAAYDAVNQKLIILYMKSDYTSDADRTFRAADLFDTSENGYYSTVAYRIYDTKSNKFLSYTDPEFGYPEIAEESSYGFWDTYFKGQLFPKTSVTGIEDPLILDITATCKNGMAYISYTVDSDNDLETAEDRDVYLMTYSFATNVFTDALKVSDIYPGDAVNTVNESPQFATYHNRLYLFYTSNSSVYYVDADLLLNHEPSHWDDPGVDGTDDKTHIDLLPKAASIALDGTDKDNLATDYQVLVGDDRKLYLVWTEPTLRYVDPDSVSEHQIYASVYYGYEEVQGDVAAPAPAGYGNWSGKVQLTAGPGKYSDVSAAVMADGHILLVAKKDDLETNSPPEMVCMTLLPAVRAEIPDDIAFGTEHPQPGESTPITASFKNLSLMALSDVSVDFFALQNGVQIPIGTVELEQDVCGGETVAATIDYAPENLDGLTINAVLSAFDPNAGETAVLATKETAFPYSTEFDFNILRLNHVAQDYYSFYTEVLHTGNKPIGSGTLILSLVEVDGQLREIKRIPLAEDVLAKEFFIVNETFTLPNSDLRAIDGVIGGSADLSVCIVSGDETIISRQSTVIKNLNDSYGDNIAAISSIILENETLTLFQGAGHTLIPEVTTVNENITYTMAYRSSNPTIASVSDSGVITAHRPGSATITAYALPEVSMRIMSEDGFGSDGSLFDMLLSDDFRSDSIELTVLNYGSVVPPSTDATISQIGDQVEGSIPYTIASDEDPNGLVVYYLDDSGERTIIPDCRYDSASGRMIFRTSHLSKYAVGYNPISFDDVSQSAWYAPAVRFLAAREITSGTSATTFSPEAVLTRGQFITLLLRAYGIEERTGDNFSDAGNSYYAGYLAAAKQLNISKGVGNNSFAPEKSISRQEMFTLLYNVLEILDRLPQKDSDKTSSSFVDNTEIATYAHEAITYFVEAGIVSGSNGKLDPTGSSTRAQMAQVLYNLLNK